ncbi:MAG: hypothetical protein Q9199_007326 [Rusavskia elegans]
MAQEMRERGMDTADMDIWEVNSFDPVRKIRLKQTAYFNAFNTAAGIIVAKGNWRSSDQNKKEDQLQRSEIMYQTWKEAAAQAEKDQLPHGPISNLRAVVQSNVVNHGTLEIFRAAYKENKLEPWEDPHWRSWTEDSHISFFLGMLGTDNVKGTIWLLNDHAAEIGRKEISAIHTMWDEHLDICPRLPHPIPHTPDNILAKMRLQTIFLPLVSLATLATAAEVTTENTLTNTCTRKTQRGNSIEVHYRGTLASDGSVFDTSYKRGQPLSFTVGKGMVIKG